MTCRDCNNYDPSYSICKLSKLEVSPSSNCIRKNNDYEKVKRNIPSNNV
jgi:hypothetical protein